MDKMISKCEALLSTLEEAAEYPGSAENFRFFYVCLEVNDERFCEFATQYMLATTERIGESEEMLLSGYATSGILANYQHYVFSNRNDIPRQWIVGARINLLKAAIAHFKDES